MSNKSSEKDSISEEADGCEDLSPEEAVLPLDCIGIILTFGSSFQDFVNVSFSSKWVFNFLKNNPHVACNIIFRLPNPGYNIFHHAVVRQKLFPPLSHVRILIIKIFDESVALECSHVFQKTSNLQTLIVSSTKVKNLRGCMFEFLPQKLRSDLKVLDLGHCGNLNEISNIPSKLEVLRLPGCGKLREWNNHQIPRTVIELDLTDCKKVENKNGVLLKRLPRKMKKLLLRGCEPLQSLEGMPPEIEVLDLAHCWKVKSFDCLPTNIQVLDLTHCNEMKNKNGELKRLPRKMKRLIMRECCWLESLDGMPSEIEVLDLHHCWRVKHFKDLPKVVQELDLTHCNSLEVSDIARLPRKMRKLVLSRCFKLQGKDLDLPVVSENLVFPHEGENGRQSDSDDEDMWHNWF